MSLHRVGWGLVHSALMVAPFPWRWVNSAAQLMLQRGSCLGTQPCARVFKLGPPPSHALPPRVETRPPAAMRGIAGCTDCPLSWRPEWSPGCRFRREPAQSAWRAGGSTNLPITAPDSGRKGKGEAGKRMRSGGQAGLQHMGLASGARTSESPHPGFASCVASTLEAPPKNSCSAPCVRRLQ